MSMRGIEEVSAEGGFFIPSYGELIPLFVRGQEGRGEKGAEWLIFQPVHR